MAEETEIQKDKKKIRREIIQELIRKKRKTAAKIGIFLILTLIISSITVFVGKTKSKDRSQTAALANIITPTDWTKGAETQAVEIVTYSNFKCQDCAALYPILKQFETEFQSKIKITHRNFFEENDGTAFLAAKAAEAAGLQSKFWEMHDLIFENQKILTETEEPNNLLITLASKLSLNLDQFRSDLEKEEIVNKIKRDIEIGFQANVKKTPTLFINNTKLEGAKTYDELKMVIEKALQDKAK